MMSVNISLLVDFLIQNASIILQPPVNGDFCLLLKLFNLWLGDKILPDIKVSLDELHEMIVEINLLSPRSVLLDEEGQSALSSVKVTRINWVFNVRLNALRERLEGKAVKEDNFKLKYKSRQKDPLKQLLKILSEKNATKKTEEQAGGLTMELCTKFFQEPTAMIKLAREKARLTTPFKPIFKVCQNDKHSKVLANICFSKKDIVNAVTRNIHMPAASLHKILFQYRSLMSPDVYACSQEKIHNLPIKFSNSETSPGDCSYLDTCHKMRSCRYLHYYTLTPTKQPEKPSSKDKADLSEYTIGQCYTSEFREASAPQWISCDVRYLKFPLLGKFAAIISDPAWDIHMSLPYGTCKDLELMSLPVDKLQDEGIIILWVTGRSIDVGRKALHKWGYRMSNEMIWIKLNQLKRTIVTGRTGHWLNHSKEHLLVGVKGNPPWLNRLIDVDTIVSGTRETLRKPDEVYDMVERIVGKHSRKLEIFGRDHNVRPGWLTIGNQLTGVSLQEPMLLEAYDELLERK